LFDTEKAKKILTTRIEGVRIKLVNPVNEMKDLEKLRNFGAEVEIVERGEPAIILAKDDIKITYKATPVQIEFEPFLRTLLRLARGERELPLGDCEGEIVVFIAPVCPHCAQVVENVNRIAISNPKIRVTVVDVALYPDLGEMYQVSSVPTVVIGENVKLVGEYTLEEVVEWVKRVLCLKNYKLEYYIMLLENGRIDEVKQDVEKDEKNLITLAEIIERPELLARVGAMIVLENVFKKDPKKIRNAKLRILEILKKNNPTAVQDAIYILGKLGSKSDLPYLRKFLNSKDENIREAAEEAIEEIEKRF